MKKAFLYFLLFFPLFLTAQTNESDSVKLKAKLAVTGFWQAGNVDALIFNTKAEVSVKPWKKWVFKTTNSYTYQEFGRVKADEDILSLNFLYFNPHKTFYPQILAIASSNFRREIRLRSLFGAGVTCQVLNEGKNWLKFSVSSEYEQTEFGRDQFNLSQYNGSTSIKTWRGTLWIHGKYYFAEEKIVLSHETYFQPSVQEPDNFRWRADLGLELPISKYFTFKINYIHSYESIVIETQRREDRILTFGLTVKSY